MIFLPLASSLTVRLQWVMCLEMTTILMLIGINDSLFEDPQGSADKATLVRQKMSELMCETTGSRQKTMSLF